MVTPRPQFIEYEGIRFSGDAVAQTTGGAEVERISRAEIQRIELAFGVRSAHPVVQVLLALGIAALGLLLTGHILVWLQSGGTILRAEIIGLLLLGLGPWLAADALKRERFLKITLSRGCRKLMFEHNPDRAILTEFLKQVRSTYGYAIEDSTAA